MIKENAEFIVEALNEAGEDAEVREEYSGRGMYGSTTTGIVTNASIGSILAAVVNQIKYCELDHSEIPEFERDLSQDSMGLSTIIY